MVRQVKLFITILIFLLPFSLFSQKTPVYEYGDNEFMRGLQLYEREKYGAARQVFDGLIAEHPGSRSEVLSEAYFYRAMSAIELRNDDSEYLVHEFKAGFPESPHVNEASFRLADYFYDKNSWPSCISWYNRVDRSKLTSADLSEYHFKKGYAFYMRKDFESARVEFYEILDVKSTFQAPATYYYSHIHYVDQNYETALMGFRAIDDDPLFSEIAPYYISQILYMQKKYDEVLEYAPDFMVSVSERRLGEMAKIIGESHFMLKQYDQAIPFLETYQANTKSYSIHDRYQLAFAYYSNGEYENAMELFEQISYRRTEIAQSALYHLADCYMKLGLMGKARVSFSRAADMDFDLRIQQDALFNFAKVTFEMSLNPFNEAVRAFELYIRTYPAADNMDEAYNYLVMAYLGTRNYSMAMASLEKIKMRDENIDRANQKVAFYRGLELYKNLRFSEAEDALEVSLEFARYDPVIASRTYFWLGEAANRIGDRRTAMMYYKEFLKNNMSHQQEEYAMCHYSLGYLNFDEEQYDAALEWFGKYLRLESGNTSVNISDSYNRMADCYFVKTNYTEAIGYYEQCISSGNADMDYAMFQKGFTLGLLDRTLEKVEVLNQLINEQAQSNFVDDALFEIARSYVVLGKQNEALASYEQVVSDHPNSAYVNKALNQLGLVYFNVGEYDRALNYYERVATNYPGTPEADNALTSIKNIYVRKDNVDGYLAFVTSIGQDITMREQDSLSYTAAEIVYTQGDCDETVRSFKDYLDAFPQGRFLLNAHFYKGDCQLKLEQNEEALESLDFIISQPNNMFTQPALEAASKINFRTGNYHRAADNYRAMIENAQQKSNIFDAHLGLMRCYFELGEYSNTIEAARQLLVLDKVQEEYIREANYKIAKSFHELNEVDFALDFYKKVAYEVNSKEGAESKFRIIEILFEMDNIEEAEKEVFEIIEMNTPHQYWMGMAFLTLSDIYIVREDEFSAINTLQSLIGYYTIPDDGIIANAKQRRNALRDKAESDISPENE
ncbi:MAG: tetratricopeptide repeat protein [Bacteroidetes bacterium]|nr:tetratricopeptide repeat protein [Bacteroidota bacterium]